MKIKLGANPSDKERARLKAYREHKAQALAKVKPARKAAAKKKAAANSAAAKTKSE